MRTGTKMNGVLALASFFGLAALMLAATACAQKQPPASGSTPDPHWPSKGQVMITGILRGGIVAIGGETTGWVLEREDGSQLDLDVSAVRRDAMALVGKRARLSGEMTRKRWVERGEHDLMAVTRVESAQ